MKLIQRIFNSLNNHIDLKNYIYAMLLIFMATLPFLHDLFPNEGGRFMGFRNYRVFIYIAGSHIFSLIGWYLLFIHARFKKYRVAILVPVLMQAYQTAAYVFNAKKTKFNAVEMKIIIIFIAASILTFLFYRSLKVVKN